MKVVSIQINFKFATGLNVQDLNNTLDLFNSFIYNVKNRLINYAIVLQIKLPGFSFAFCESVKVYKGPIKVSSPGLGPSRDHRC